VTKTATLIGVSRATVSEVMSAYTNRGKATSAKRNGGRKLTVTERDRRILRRIVKTTQLPQQDRSAELNIHLEDPVSTKTVRRELHKSSQHPR
jgi:transposase